MTQGILCSNFIQTNLQIKTKHLKNWSSFICEFILKVEKTKCSVNQECFEYQFKNNWSQQFLLVIINNIKTNYMFDHIGRHLRNQENNTEILALKPC